ncbi:MAG TPA: hypothetical protein VGA52_07475 [Anaerolineales bacterium]|jgi:uncharacterized protein YgiM (DUF1202 family)
MSIRHNHVVWQLMLALLLSACSLGAPAGPTATATLTSADVLATAQAMAEATRQASTPTPTRPAATPTPSAEPPTAAPSQTGTPNAPLVIADYNANVRSYPGEAYAVIDFMLQGESANAVGQYLTEDSGLWYYITRIGEQGRVGWIWSGAVTVAGDPNQIPFLEAPPEPTDGPSPTPFGS